MFRVERKRAILEHRAALQDNVVANLSSSADSHLDAAVGRAQIVAGLSDSTLDEDGNKQKKWH
jgi:hypothetical protein